MVRSAKRLALPHVPPQMFLDGICALVAADKAWVPTAPETSLYLRPFMFASEAFLGVRPASEVTFAVIASPAGAYFPGGVKPVSLWLSQDYVRAAPGGTGAAKCGGNYAASLAPMMEASEHHCDQVVFLDARENRYVEELGGMNLFFVYRDGTVVTPRLTGTILEGVTRDAILTLLREEGRDVVEADIGIDQWRAGAASGDLTEVFACGTAAVVTPVSTLVEPDAKHVVGDGQVGPVTTAVRQTLTGIQYGTLADPYGWTRLIA
ncbi:MAG: branched chain amino acid aminotransferase [Micrococcales bacterium]|nr:MAG: branched chain amino acid aminotransferase [Micrococcales bacterium]